MPTLEEIQTSSLESIAQSLQMLVKINFQLLNQAITLRPTCSAICQGQIVPKNSSKSTVPTVNNLNNKTVINTVKTGALNSKKIAKEIKVSKISQ